MSQQPARAPIATSNRIWTIPNIISFIRLLGVPVFLYLLLGPRHDLAAVIVLTLGGTTDWVDGYVARRMGQVSRLGELLDPFADRLYILATLVGFTLREVVPWWLTAALLLRELVLGIALLVLRRHGHGPPPVHYVGKTGTFVLLGAFPVLLLAVALPDAAEVLEPLGWGLAWWALGLYWAAAALYLIQFAQLLRADRLSPPSPNGAGAPPGTAALPVNKDGSFGPPAAADGTRTPPANPGPAALPADKDGSSRPVDGAGAPSARAGQVGLPPSNGGVSGPAAVDVAGAPPAKAESAALPPDNGGSSGPAAVAG